MTSPVLDRPQYTNFYEFATKKPVLAVSNRVLAQNLNYLIGGCKNQVCGTFFRPITLTNAEYEERVFTVFYWRSINDEVVHLQWHPHGCADHLAGANETYHLKLDYGGDYDAKFGYPDISDGNVIYGYGNDTNRAEYQVKSAYVDVKALPYDSYSYFNFIWTNNSNTTTTGQGIRHFTMTEIPVPILTAGSEVGVDESWFQPGNEVIQTDSVAGRGTAALRAGMASALKDSQRSHFQLITYQHTEDCMVIDTQTTAKLKFQDDLGTSFTAAPKFMIRPRRTYDWSTVCNYKWIVRYKSNGHMTTLVLNYDNGATTDSIDFELADTSDSWTTVTMDAEIPLSYDDHDAGCKIWFTGYNTSESNGLTYVSNIALIEDNFTP